MTTKTIALIQKNRIVFDRMEEFAVPLLYKELDETTRAVLKKNLNDYLWSVIEPYIQFIDITVDDDFIANVCKNLTNCYPERTADEFFYHTEASYSFPKRYMELIYGQPMWPEYAKNDSVNINTVGCYFSLKHNVIENNCIIIANRYDLAAKHFAVMDNVTREDILRVVRRRYFFTAILIKNDNVVKYYYQNPQYLITQIYGINKKDDIQKLSFSHLKYNLVYYFQQDTSKYVNSIATRINGSYRVHGDILVLHELEENIYGNISVHEIKRLNVLSYGRLYDRQLQENEMHTIESIEPDETGKPINKPATPMWSKYIVIENRMKKWQAHKNLCINCGKDMVNIITCQKCYRARYCSTICQKEFDWYHNDECFNS